MIKRKSATQWDIKTCTEREISTCDDEIKLLCIISADTNTEEQKVTYSIPHKYWIFYILNDCTHTHTSYTYITYMWYISHIIQQMQASSPPSRNALTNSIAQLPLNKHSHTLSTRYYELETNGKKYDGEHEGSFTRISLSCKNRRWRMMARKFAGRDDELNHHFGLRLSIMSQLVTKLPKKHRRSSYLSCFLWTTILLIPSWWNMSRLNNEM